MTGRKENNMKLNEMSTRAKSIYYSKICNLIERLEEDAKQDFELAESYKESAIQRAKETEGENKKEPEDFYDWEYSIERTRDGKAKLEVLEFLKTL